MLPPNADILPNAKAAAAFAGISEGLLRKLVAKGDFPSRYYSSTGKTQGRGGKRTFSKTDILAWMNSKSHNPSPTSAPRLPQPDVVSVFAEAQAARAALSRLADEVQRILPDAVVTSDGHILIGH